MSQIRMATNGSARDPVSEAGVREIVTAAVGQSLPDDLDLLASGLIDSFGFLELIALLEERLGIEVDLEGLDTEQLTVVGPFCRHVAGTTPDQRGGGP
jgi:acyl carrier protein